MTYDGPDGIGAILSGLTRFGWEPVREGDAIIALTQGGCAITLEPGGQFELSGAPLETIHQTCDEVNDHLNQVREVCGELGVGMLGLGFDPSWRREEIGWMPKGRYAIMRRWMQEKGSLGLDMMLRTCTVQTNLDFSDEADMVEKFRVSLALQPVATALFANSPFREGRPTGFLSTRSHVWTDTDPDRCGILPFVFEPGFGFERHVDYILDVPMYFVYRDGIYHDVAGASFRDFMAGRLPGFEGQRRTRRLGRPMTTNFPEVRLKKYLEMRGADSGPHLTICALSAFWVGLLYDASSQASAWEMVRDWTADEHATLRRDVPGLGLATPFRGGTLQEVARTALALAHDGCGAGRGSMRPETTRPATSSRSGRWPRAESPRPRPCSWPTAPAGTGRWTRSGRRCATDRPRFRRR